MRKAFTLLELVMSIAIAAILLMGMSASIMIASQAVGDGMDTVGQVLHTSDILAEISSEISAAGNVLERTTTSVTLAVPDRDGDGKEEVLRYWWTGPADARLIRQINAGAEVVLAEDVRHFSLSFGETTMDVEESKDGDDGRNWYGRKRRPRWGWYWDHHGHAWGHYKQGHHGQGK